MPILAVEVFKVRRPEYKQSYYNFRGKNMSGELVHQIMRKNKHKQCLPIFNSLYWILKVNVILKLPSREHDRLTFICVMPKEI